MGQNVYGRLAHRTGTLIDARTILQPPALNKNFSFVRLVERDGTECREAKSREKRKKTNHDKLLLMEEVARVRI